MTRRVLWMPDGKFAHKLRDTMLEAGIIDPEKTTELHATVAGGWPYDYQPIEQLPQPASAVALEVVKLIKHNNTSWSRLALLIYAPDLNTLRTTLAKESGKTITQLSPPHITLSRTTQEITPYQQMVLQRLKGMQFDFVREVGMTPDREHQILRRQLVSSGILLSP